MTTPNKPASPKTTPKPGGQSLPPEEPKTSAAALGAVGIELGSNAGKILCGLKNTGMSWADVMTWKECVVDMCDESNGPTKSVEQAVDEIRQAVAAGKTPDDFDD